VRAAQRAKRARLTYHESDKLPVCLMSRTCGQRQAAREAGRVIRIARANGLDVFMAALL